MAILSGAYWINQFPNSKSVSDLSPLFRPNVENFLAALGRSGASVVISATLRPAQRAYLMHYSFDVARGGLNPERVPTRAGVDIDWVHRDHRGNADPAASRNAAEEMVRGYQIVFRPALASRHTEGTAIDMTISWNNDLTIARADGNNVTIRSIPKDGTNIELAAVGISYGVNKLATDPPHWSSDGH